MFADLAQLTISGLATGAIYALAAMGFTLLWQTSSTINFAQGEFVMVPAFIMLGFLGIGMPLIFAFALTLAASALIFGVGFKRAVVDPMIRHGVLPLAIAAMALSLALQQGVKLVFGAEARSVPDILPDGVTRIVGVAVSYRDVGVLVISFVLILGLQLFLARTLTGRAMQASAQNPDGARVLGINVDRMILYTFLANAALASIAALLVTPIYLAKFDLGGPLGLKAFCAAIIGGFNQMHGALAGGLLIGVIENLTGAYFAPQYKDAAALVLFVIVILFKPEGLFGRREERRV
ncbi:MAG: branched-chain amino acid ABC transporter permease [Alphaproteobacteria bacterium]|nr:branched-chain amino acid ABC transporter permease [Alphaproteobacteria bacterium]